MTGWFVAAVALIALAAVLGARWWEIALVVGVGLLVGAVVWLLDALARSTSIWR